LAARSSEAAQSTNDAADMDVSDEASAIAMETTANAQQSSVTSRPGPGQLRFSRAAHGIVREIRAARAMTNPACASFGAAFPTKSLAAGAKSGAATTAAHSTEQTDSPQSAFTPASQSLSVRTLAAHAACGSGSGTASGNSSQTGGSSQSGSGGGAFIFNRSVEEREQRERRTTFCEATGDWQGADFFATRPALKRVMPTLTTDFTRTNSAPAKRSAETMGKLSRAFNADGHKQQLRSVQIGTATVSRLNDGCNQSTLHKLRGLPQQLQRNSTEPSPPCRRKQNCSAAHSLLRRRAETQQQQQHHLQQQLEQHHTQQKLPSHPPLHPNHYQYQPYSSAKYPPGAPYPPLKIHLPRTPSDEIPTFETDLCSSSDDASMQHATGSAAAIRRAKIPWAKSPPDSETVKELERSNAHHGAYSSANASHHRHPSSRPSSQRGTATQEHAVPHPPSHPPSRPGHQSPRSTAHRRHALAGTRSPSGTPHAKLTQASPLSSQPAFALPPPCATSLSAPLPQSIAEITTDDDANTTTTAINFTTATTATTNPKTTTTTTTTSTTAQPLPGTRPPPLQPIASFSKAPLTPLTPATPMLPHEGAPQQMGSSGCEHAAEQPHTPQPLTPRAETSLGADFSPPVLRPPRCSPQLGACAPLFSPHCAASPHSDARGHSRSNSLHEAPRHAADAHVRLCYDHVLDCYYDPETNKYYELSL